MIISAQYRRELQRIQLDVVGPGRFIAARIRIRTELLGLVPGSAAHHQLLGISVLETELPIKAGAFCSHQ